MSRPASGDGEPHRGHDLGELDSRPGVEEDRQLRIRPNAGIHAEGTEEEPIVLTGTTAERGFWAGVELTSNGRDDHVITHTTIEHTEGYPFGLRPAGRAISGGTWSRGG